MIINHSEALCIWKTPKRKEKKQQRLLSQSQSHLDLEKRTAKRETIREKVKSHRNFDFPYMLRCTDMTFSRQASRVSWSELCHREPPGLVSSLRHSMYGTLSVRLWMKPLRRSERQNRLIRSVRLRIRWAFLWRTERERERSVCRVQARIIGNNTWQNLKSFAQRSQVLDFQWAWNAETSYDQFNV